MIKIRKLKNHNNERRNWKVKTSIDTFRLPQTTSNYNVMHKNKTKADLLLQVESAHYHNTAKSFCS
jgi:hypothetical protein